ncbi:unnamed protein product [Orchesella dallaii]|uniref:C2H2-type domain-containing protein n=1 Tax=Orchesella dallaii TaxID=48710 RepID=A0ABP1S064_9HEXA
MVTCVLECSVCQNTFDTRKEWLTHLLQPDHQSKARKEICLWGQPERDCGLVAFSALPLAALELLQFFSKGSMDIVTDFVCFGNRPNVGFIQFESKQKVEEILSNLGVPEIRVNNQQIYIKRAGQYHHLEWQELIPLHFHELLENPNNQESESVSLSPPEIIINAGAMLHSGVKESSTEGTPNVNDANLSLGAVVKMESAQFLSTQYDAVCQEIKISDEEFSTAQKFVETLQNAFAKKYPACQIVWYRNWFLKLKSNTTNELLCFVDQKGIYGKQSTDIFANFASFPSLDNGKYSEMFLNIPHLKISEITDNNYKWGEYFLCEANGIIFNIAPVPHSKISESQTCRLLAYLCSFDQRLKPLLTVIRYWAKVNQIKLADPHEISSRRAPDPAALDWLVVFFLCYRMSILPTPREIMEKSHPKLEFHFVDIGFSEDPSFVQQHSDRYNEPDQERHLLNVFNLAKGFFKFYSEELNLGMERQIVLNMKDAEIIPLKGLFGEIEQFETKLSKEERKFVTNRKNRGVKRMKSFQLLHPLNLLDGLSFCDKNFVTCVCPVMEITGKKLEQALDLYKSGDEFDIKFVFKI